MKKININLLTKFQWVLVIFIFFQIANEAGSSQVEVSPRVNLMKIGSKEQQLDNLFRVLEKQTLQINKLYLKQK